MGVMGAFPAEGGSSRSQGGGKGPSLFPSCGQSPAMYPNCQVKTNQHSGQSQSLEPQPGPCTHSLAKGQSVLLAFTGAWFLPKQLCHETLPCALVIQSQRYPLCIGPAPHLTQTQQPDPFLPPQPQPQSLSVTILLGGTKAPCDQVLGSPARSGNFFFFEWEL